MKYFVICHCDRPGRADEIMAACPGKTLISNCHRTIKVGWWDTEVEARTARHKVTMVGGIIADVKSGPMEGTR